MGGGNRGGSVDDCYDGGLSPRGRGKRGAARTTQNRWRSIPAWAGETVDQMALGYRIRVYPRVGGGNLSGLRIHTRHDGLSPRGRGKPVYDIAASGQNGSIPAWAGETRPAGAVHALPGVYPRVGGGNPSVGFFVTSGVGLSPRGRGKPMRCLAKCNRDRSIPAWAGETAPLCSRHRIWAVYPRVGGGNTAIQTFG